MIRKMSVEPNRIMGTAGGTLSTGAIADITIIDPEANWVVNPQHFFSKSRNTAFNGFSLKGYAWMTFLVDKSCSGEKGRKLNIEYRIVRLLIISPCDSPK